MFVWDPEEHPIWASRSQINFHFTKGNLKSDDLPIYWYFLNGSSELSRQITSVTASMSPCSPLWPLTSLTASVSPWSPLFLASTTSINNFHGLLRDLFSSHHLLHIVHHHDCIIRQLPAVLHPSLPATSPDYLYKETLLFRASSQDIAINEG